MSHNNDLPAKFDFPAIARKSDYPYLDIVLLVCTSWFFISFLSIFHVGEIFAGPFMAWMNLYNQHGLVDGYWKIKDVYPPGTFTFLSAAFELSKTLDVEKFVSFKIFQGAFFLISSALAYYASRNIMITLIFQISIFVNALIFSSIDIFFVPFLMLTLIALKKDNFILASFSITAAILIKWQPVFLAPFLIIFLIQRTLSTDKKLQLLLKSIVPSVLVVISTGVIFGFGFLTKLFAAGATGATSYSANTFNLGWTISHFLAESEFSSIQIIWVGPNALGILAMKAAFLMIFLFIATKHARHGKGSYIYLLISMALGEAAFLVLYPGIHANYWIVLSVILLFLSEHPLGLRLFLYTGLMAGINLLFIYSWSFPRVYGHVDITLFLALANCILLVTGLARFYSHQPRYRDTQ